MESGGHTDAGSTLKGPGAIMLVAGITVKIVLTSIGNYRYELAIDKCDSQSGDAYR